MIQDLFLSWYPSLVRYAHRVCGDLYIAEEAVQESFMALYRELMSGHPVRNPKGWTLVVVKREIGRRRRSQVREREQLDQWASLGLGQPTSSPAEAGDQLAGLFSVLSHREEEVLLLRMQTLSYDEIAKQLEISRNSVKTFLARAFRKLRSAAGTTDPAEAAGRVFLFTDSDVPETLQ